MAEYSELNALQAKWLACMLEDISLVDKTSIVPSFVGEGYRDIFSYFKLCRKENRLPEPMDFVKKYPASYDCFEQVVGELENDLGYLKSKFGEYEKTIVEILKDVHIHKATEQFNRGKIDRELFIAKCNEIDSIATAQKRKCTSSRAKELLLDKKQNLFIPHYDSISESLALEQHSFVIIAAGTGGGKSTFAMNVMDRMVDEYPVLYFNMEMGEAPFLQRWVATRNGIPLKEIRENFEAYVDKADFIDECDVELYNESLDLEEMRAAIARHDQQEHFIVFIDNISNISSPQGKSLYETTTYIAKSIRAMALAYNCTVFGLCQVSRPDKSKIKRITTKDGRVLKETPPPTLTSLRDSGELEQSADKVFLLYEEYEEGVDDLVYKVEIAKNRNNTPGEVFEMYFNKSTLQINEIV